MKKLLVAGIIIGLLGCFYQTYNYYYASLEDSSDAEVVVRKKLNVKDLVGNSIAPTEYVIARRAYTLNFTISEEIRRANFKITVRGYGNETLLLKPVIDMNRSSKHGVSCAYYELNETDPSSMLFEWNENCVEDELKKAVLFDIVDMSGNIVASENIPFVLVRDGKFGQFDAL